MALGCQRMKFLAGLRRPEGLRERNRIPIELEQTKENHA